MIKYYKYGWAIAIVLILILFTGISYYLESHLKLWMQNIVREELLQDAQSTSGALSIISSDFSAKSLDFIVDKMHQNNNNRVTVIDSTGAVVADTKLTLAEVLKTENHRDRPEFLSASEKVPGESIRYSHTLEENMLYVAIPFVTDRFSGYIRASQSLVEIGVYTEKLRSIQKIVALIGFAVLSVFFVFSYVLLQKNNDLQKKKLRRKVKQKTKSLLHIQKISEMLASCSSIDELADVVSSTVPIIFPDSSGALSITHPSMDHNEVISHWGKNWQGEVLYQPAQCWGFRKGSPYISTENSVEVKCSHLNISKQYSSICVPLLAQSVAIGVLHIVLDNKLSKDTRSRFVTVADNLSLAVANINLREKLKREAIRDPLTNLYNRRFLDEALHNELLRAERNKQSLGVLMIDVDHFKTFNDSFGHDAGDQALQELSQVLSKLVRGEDIACRYGGEEFIVVFPNITHENVLIRADEILQTVRGIDLTFKSKPLGNITLSIGIAVYPDQGKSAEELISVADAALYQAKSNGRNQIIMAQI